MPCVRIVGRFSDFLENCEGGDLNPAANLFKDLIEMYVGGT